MVKRQKHHSYAGWQQDSPVRQQDTETSTYIRYGPRPQTWPARMPPYCLTELCPDPARRR